MSLIHDKKTQPTKQKNQKTNKTPKLLQVLARGSNRHCKKTAVTKIQLPFKEEIRCCSCFSLCKFKIQKVLIEGKTGTDLLDKAEAPFTLLLL